ncbi:hypothetical protein [Caballeronia ptereochthonis]|nr:hypothetical protein [Caballeronia ptereochthonis]
MNESRQAPAQASEAPDSCAAGKRNRYFRSKQMRAGDFSLEQRYGIGRRRMLTRAIAGWGVACGFELTSSDEKGGTNRTLACGTGLALDRHGRELVRMAAGPLALCDVLLLGDLQKIADDKARAAASGTQAPASDPVDFKCLLQAHYSERNVDRVRTDDGCGCGEDEWNHVCETLTFSLAMLACGRCESSEDGCMSCGCCVAAPAQPPDAGHDANPETTGDAPVQLPADATPLDRGPHGCLCEWQTHRPVSDGSGDLCTCEGAAIAIEDGVPLACVTIRFDECGCPVIVSIDDACGPRRLVKTNDLLFDLIRGCDLTRIVDVSWKKWHRKGEVMPWTDFQAYFPSPSDSARQPRAPVGPVRTGFSMTFSGPVMVDTLTPDCVKVSVRVAEHRGGWIESDQMPVVDLAAADPSSGDPDGTTRSVSLVVGGPWCRDEIWNGPSELDCEVACVEIQVFGDFILDCRGQAVDANPVGLRAAPSGNGTPGGTYLSLFRIAPRG